MPRAPMQPVTPLWNSAALKAALQPLAIRGDLVGDATGVSIDTRTLQAGDLFIALAGDPGPRFHSASASQGDGHDYLQAALGKQCRAAVVSRFVDLPLTQIKVANTLDGLWDLAKASRARTRAQVVALTGSSGKTTLKQFLAQATSGYADAGSLNNFWGLPLSLSRLPQAAILGIFEIGMNRPGEIAQLAVLARPDVAVVLNALPAHLEHFSGLGEIVREKLSIAEGLNPSGILVLPDQLAHRSDFSGTRYTFGMQEGADVRLLFEDEGRRLQLRVKDALATQNLQISLPAGGQHRQLTAAATLATVLALGGQPEVAAKRLAKLSLLSGRGHRMQAGGIGLIDESYNANPTSMAATLRAFRAETVQGAKYAILGDMLELGDAAADFHRALAAECQGLDGLWLVGPMMRSLAEALPKHRVLGSALSASELSLDDIAQQLTAGDQILVKGSNKVFWQEGFVQQLAARLAADSSEAQ